MKLLIFLSLFFYQTLHANILYPLPAHKFDFSTSAYNSSNPSKKRTLASITTNAKRLLHFMTGLVFVPEPDFRIDTPNENFFRAVVSKDLEGVRDALAKGADPTYYVNTDNLYKDSPVLTETEQKIIEVIKEAQRVYYLNSNLSHGVRTTDLDKVIEYLKKGADPNIRHYSHASHLLQSALRSGIVKKLPLIEEHEKIVEALLKHGADPNLYAKDLPPLHLAVFFKNPKIVKLLIKYGANVNFQYYNDVTPLLLVVDPLETEKNFEQYIRGYNEDEFKFRSKNHLELNKEITQALLDAGADINEKTLGGNTLLVNAAAGGKPDFAAFLIKKGANLEEAIKTIKAYQSFLKNENISLESSYLPAANILKNKVQLSILQTSLQLFEIQKSIEQRFKNREIKSPENDNKKPSCPGAFG